MKAPGPPGWPLVGHLPVYLPRKLQFLRECQQKFGSVVRLDMPGPTYLLTCPDDLRHVLESHHTNYGKSERMTGARGRALLGSGLLTRSGPAHLEQRRKMQAAFHEHLFGCWAEQLADLSAESLQEFPPGQPLGLVRWAFRLSQEMILRILFGPVEVPRGPLEIRRQYIEYWFASLFPRPEWLPHPRNLRFRRIQRELETFLREQAARGSGYLISLLRQASPSQSHPMSTEELFNELLVLTLTGYETVAEGLAWTAWLLARHPEWQQRIREESPDGPALNWCLNESLRLYPPTWIYVRMPQGPDRLPSGLTVNRGDKLYLSPYVSQRISEFFPEPDRYAPQRWENSSPLPRYAFYPFGGGPRLCIGKALAMLEMKTALRVLVQSFHLRALNEPRVQAGLTLGMRPEGLVELTRIG